LFIFAIFDLTHSQQWTITNEVSATTITGVGVASNNLAVGATSFLAVGASVERYNGQRWQKESLNAPIIFDSAVSNNTTVVGSYH
jgi:hypothetical protein